ncbi:MAG: hypothetical protein KA519_02045 [Bacteroides sp.]|uniref:hypothetical protein n=1 Tax=Bacteroides sp. TaxID=29523 RepID=UPI001B7BBFA8|nr:hypothetical protein [Bacteroides sp.]MBP6066849.1 hypothetical protein [Bacteroides sp.]MBP9586068.1 hypothetical protein [Bacteroides sp.]
MRVKSEYEKASGFEIWDIAVDYINKNKVFESIRGVRYEASASGESIDYKGGLLGSKRATEGESMNKQLFVSAYNKVSNLDCINTTNVKPYIDRKQSPFVGLLKSAGIIE